jgi:hypothetical protein
MYLDIKKICNPLRWLAAVISNHCDTILHGLLLMALLFPVNYYSRGGFTTGDSICVSSTRRLMSPNRLFNAEQSEVFGFGCPDKFSFRMAKTWLASLNKRNLVIRHFVGNGQWFMSNFPISL